MDTEELIQKYTNVSREEVEKIRKTSQYPVFNKVIFEKTIWLLHKRREKEKIKGIEAVVGGHLLHVFSVHVLRDKIDENKPLIVYGRIYVQFRDVTSGKLVSLDLFNRQSNDAKILGPSGLLITLMSPDHSCCSFHSCMPLHKTKLVVDICAGGKNLVAESFCCAVEDMIDFEQVRLEYVHGELGSLSVRYVAMPFAVYGEVEVVFFRKQDYNLDEKDHRSLNVIGRVVARYGNTYEGDDSEECVLFEKHSNEPERVDLDSGKSMKLSRCWIAVPSFSSLIIDVDLSELGTERKLLKEIIELPVKNERVCGEDFIIDDILINVRVGWFSPRPQGRCIIEECVMEVENESDDDVSPRETCEEENDDEQMTESCSLEAPSNLSRPWILSAHQNRPFSSSAVQIFSVFIGREKSKALRVYGSIEVSSLASTLSTFHVFKREPLDAFGLSENNKTLPLVHCSGEYDDSDSLEIKLDLKDVENCFHIRGYVMWDSRSLEFGTPWLNKQLCSVIQGQHGFAAIHYSIFTEAVQANVEVLFVPKNGNSVVQPKVYGSIIAQYNNYDCTSSYNKDHFQISLFQRNEEDSAQPQASGVIELSQTVVVVPVHSSLIVEANLCIVGSDQVLSQCLDVHIGSSNNMVMEGNDFSIHIPVKWGEVSN